MKPNKSHNAYNLEGCVSLRMQKPTPWYEYYTLVGVWASDESGMESDHETPWTTSCEGHSTLVSSRTLVSALLCDTTDFCDDCREGKPPTKETGAWVAFRAFTKDGAPRKRSGKV